MSACGILGAFTCTKVTRLQSTLLDILVSKVSCKLLVPITRLGVKKNPQPGFPPALAERLFKWQKLLFCNKRKQLDDKSDSCKAVDTWKTTYCWKSKQNFSETLVNPHYWYRDQFLDEQKHLFVWWAFQLFTDPITSQIVSYNSAINS